MKRVRLLVSLIVVVAFVVGTVYVARAAAPTMDEAKAMAEKALAYWKANGREKALAAFNNPHGQFIKGQMYVTVGDHGTVLANPANPNLLGTNSWDLKDPEGKYFVREFLETAKKGGGWVDYTFANPFTHKIQKKTTYVLPVPDDPNIDIG